MNVVKITVPALMQGISRQFTMKTRQAETWNAKHSAYGTFREKFAQRQLMGNIESTAQAISTLECNGSVTVIVTGGRCIVNGELTVFDSDRQSLATTALTEIQSRAAVLANVHPRATFELRMLYKTSVIEVSTG